MLWASQKKPTIVQDENFIANLIRRKLLKEPNASNKAAMFGHLYNKLASQSVDSQQFISPGLKVFPSPHLLPAHARTYELQEPPRNTRRKLAREEDHERETSMSSDRRLPPAIQLEKARKLASDGYSSATYVPESALLRDLIFIFQGIDGQYIKLDPVSNEYSIDSKAMITKSTKDLVHYLSELGWLYKRILLFVKSRSNDQAIGLVGQSFCSTLHNELTEYYRLIAVLEAQIKKQTSLIPSFDEALVLPNEKTLTLRRLVVWTQESLQQLRLMCALVDACQEQKGGALVSNMHNYTKHGDPFIQNYVRKMLQKVSTPFYEMLQRWIYAGELDDPYKEFFIACDPTVPEEELWQSQYSIREDMLPSFISKELALKIFSIGKSLNFIRHSCHDDTLVEKYSTSDHKYMLTFKYGDVQAVKRSIDVAYMETSKHLINLLTRKYKLMEHLRAMKRYLLLGQGDFIQYLMDTLRPGLSMPATSLFRHNLTGILETAIRASNAQYDENEILNRLDVRLLQIESQDLGWDVFTLDYHVDSPINTVFNPLAMSQYLRIFNFLWRLKRVEYTLSSSWRQWGIASRNYGRRTEISQDLHEAQLTISRMVHFIYQLQHYYLFEVLECSWENLSSFIENKSIDLDSIIEAHSSYLGEILDKGFLSDAKIEKLAAPLNIIFDIVLGYESSLDRLYLFISSKSVQGELMAPQGLPQSSKQVLQEVRGQCAKAEGDFKKNVLEFLVMLGSYHDEDLRSLSTRLNYNNYYSSS
ncbi:Spc98 family-domain-containing protein [Spinellus fusiger]|nr:Spc98 family-domain-containing protein [Spinellus fusiger]